MKSERSYKKITALALGLCLTISSVTVSTAASDSLLSVTEEAQIRGFEPARAFVLRFILNDIERKQLFYDSKTIFQEIVQEKGLQPVEYVLTEEKGPDHDKQFTVEVRVNGEVFGCGTGHTKKAAEQAAAYQAIQEKKI